MKKGKGMTLGAIAAALGMGTEAPAKVVRFTGAVRKGEGWVVPARKLPRIAYVAREGFTADEYRDARKARKLEQRAARKLRANRRRRTGRPWAAA